MALIALVLAGCAATAAPTPQPPTAQVEGDRFGPRPVQLSDKDADLVIARAIAEHEMRRP